MKLALQCWRWEFAPPENMAAEEVDMWSWDTPYLKDILVNKISEGEQEYLDYLRPGNPEISRAKYIFAEVKEATETSAFTGEW